MYETKQAAIEALADELRKTSHILMVDARDRLMMAEARPDGKVPEYFDVSDSIKWFESHDEYVNKTVVQFTEWDGTNHDVDENQVASTARSLIGKLYLYKRNAQDAARRAEIVRCVVAAVIKLGRQAERGDNGHLFVDGENVGYYLDVARERMRVGYLRELDTGRYRVTVGAYGDKASYPQKKDGSHNYTKIAERLISLANQAKARQQRESQTTANRATVAALRNELGVPEWGMGPLTLNYTDSASHPVAFSFKTSRSMTEAEARKMVATLRAAGLVAE